MSSVAVLISVLVVFALGYRFYARFLEKEVGIDDSKPTPAFEKYDGVDYVPAKHWMILFGHHFSSIAGAGPIVGPILACIWWGWVPAVIWAMLGSVFIGGVHDFLAMAISAKEGGESIGVIASKYISRRAGLVFLIFVWLALVLVVAVFALVCAKTFVEEPRIVLPSLGIIPVAVLIGFLVYRFNTRLLWATVIGLSLLAGFIWLGSFYKITLAKNYWMAVLMIYAFFASIIPVNFLLQPRDYLSAYLLFFSLAVMSIGVLLVNPQISFPAVKSLASAKGGPLFPMMFITMACGAVSGFHSLVASGTSSKQLIKQSHAKRIGYLGMLSEGLLAVLVVICLTAGVKHLGISPDKVNGSYAIKLFSEGFGRITYFLTKSWGKFIAVIVLNAFILTTLDTATRITRYVTQELFHIKSKILSTLLVVASAFGLIVSGGWQKLWQVFGASNQLLASLAFLAAASWLLTYKKKYLLAFIPGIFMLLVSLSAVIIKARQFFVSGNNVLFFVSLVLALLGLFVLVEVIRNNRALNNK